MFSRKRDSVQDKKPGTISRLLSRAAGKHAPEGLSIVRDPPSTFQSSPFPHSGDDSSVPQAPPSPSQHVQTSAAKDVQLVDSVNETFNLRIARDLWPEFSPGESVLQATGQLFFDFTDSSQTRWARGENTAMDYGTSIFPSKAQSAPPPKKLFDLDTLQVVTTSCTDRVPYTIISHVWGDTPYMIDGKKYGIDWQIPIRRTAKLEQILTSARIIGGHRYIWIDILCLDQRERNEAEIAMMREYYANASGCLVWLDNGGATNNTDWMNVLAGIEEVNKFYKMDRSGVSTRSAAQMMQENIGEVNMTGQEAYAWIKKIVAIEKCPWFHRIWTMQEAVIPEAIYFCTPERYMCGGAAIFQIMSICGLMAQLLIQAGSHAGVAVNHELQKSEIWKILRLRQLYRNNSIGYWHLFQASRNRSCMIEQDKIFGLIGLVHGRVPTIDYSRSLNDLYLDLWRSSVELGDFAAISYLGDGHTPIEPDMYCLPNIISPGAPKVAETHRFTIMPNAIKLEGVGITTVSQVWSIVTYGSLQAWHSPAFLDLTKGEHISVAKAFGTSPETVGESMLCPGAFAGISGLNPLGHDLIAAFGQEFEEKYNIALPQGQLMWTKSGFLMQASEDNAFVVIWTKDSPDEPMLAVVTERVEGSVVVITPGSYLQVPGEGCILCAVNPDGSGRKIGLGIGKKIKVNQLADFVML